MASFGPDLKFSFFCNMDATIRALFDVAALRLRLQKRRGPGPDQNLPFLDGRELKR
jgi:hypothetical protein